jgi:hypothetical protein
MVTIFMVTALASPLAPYPEGEGVKRGVKSVKFSGVHKK